MSNALNTYGEGAAAASVDMFDTVMELEGLTVRGTIRSGIITQAEVDRIAHYQATKLLRDDVDGFIEQMANSTAFMTRQVANGTTMAQSAYMQYRGGWEFRQNLRNGRGRAVWSYSTNGGGDYQIRYARVPQGLETCDFCLMLASRGFVYLTAESAEGWNHTHRGCVVAGTKVSGRGLRAGFVREYEGALVKLTTAEGRELTVTPNHPVLTLMGWVRADELKEGDYLVCTAFNERSLGGVPDDDDVPPNVEDVIEACRLADSARLDGVPRTAVNLDGSPVDGEVNVVSSHGYLASGGNPALFEEGGELCFAGAHGDFPACRLLLDGERVPDSLGFGLDPASGGGVGGGGLLLPFGACHLGSPDDSSFGTAALGDSVLPEPTLNDVSGNAEPVCNGVDALAVLERFYGSLGHGNAVLSSFDHLCTLVPRDSVTFEDSVDVGFSGAEALADFCRADTSFVKLDKLVGIDVIENARTHVYNLHTQDNLYAANGIITHNCDCIVVAGVVHKEHGALVQDTVLEGYEPETLSKVYQSWDGLSDSEAKLDALESVTGRREW